AMVLPPPNVLSFSVCYRTLAPIRPLTGGDGSGQSSTFPPPASMGMRRLPDGQYDLRICAVNESRYRHGEVRPRTAPTIRGGGNEEERKAAWRAGGDGTARFPESDGSRRSGGHFDRCRARGVGGERTDPHAAQRWLRPELRSGGR